MEAVRQAAGNSAACRHQRLRGDVPTHDVVAGVVPLFSDEDAVTRLRQVEGGQDVGKGQHGHRSIIRCSPRPLAGGGYPPSE